MMKNLIVAFVVALAFVAQEGKADVGDYTSTSFLTKLDYSKDSTEDNIQIIRYYIKQSEDFKPNGPVLYGVSGQESVDQFIGKYGLLDKTDAQFANATVVFAEQRFFGNSKLGDPKPINSIDRLKQLTLANTVNDHVELIKRLANDLKTKNFLVFGVGNYSLMAGFVANKFATDATLMNDYKVLGWMSSPPLKYLLIDDEKFKDFDFQEINKKAASILKSEGVCDSSDIEKFTQMWKFLKSLRSGAATDNTDVQRLKVNAPPTLDAAAESNDIKQFVVFMRNAIRDLIPANRLYDTDTNSKRTPTPVLKDLCQKIRLFDNSATTTAKIGFVNGILGVLFGAAAITTPNCVTNAGVNTCTFRWRAVESAAAATPVVWNEPLAKTYYQSCTNYQFASCPKDNVDVTDPFTGTQWDTTIVCNDKNSLLSNLQKECDGILGSGISVYSTMLKKDDGFVQTLKQNVIVTMSTQSLYADSYASYVMDSSEKLYSYAYSVWGIAGLDLEVPRRCDTPKVRDVRYSVLKGFGCFTKLVDNSMGTCNNWYDDHDPKKPFPDSKPTVGACPADSSPRSVFPFGRPRVPFQDPNRPKTTSTTKTSTSTRPTRSTASTTASVGSTKAGSGSGAGGVSATMSVVFASVYVVFVTFNNNNNNN